MLCSRLLRVVVVLTLTTAASSCRGKRDREILGGLDLDAYCRSTGKARSLWKQVPGQFDGKKTWGCEDSTGGWATISLGAACAAQYKTPAHAEQDRGDDPTSWLCVKGPLAGEPAPHWNRANL